MDGRSDHQPASHAASPHDAEQDLLHDALDPVYEIGRGELALQQLQQLPTLSGIAVRILNLTSEEDFRAQEVIELISHDPALAARVIKLCRCSPRGRASEVNTLERAVLLMGFEAIRSIVLSVQVFEAMELRTGGSQARLGLRGRRGSGVISVDSDENACRFDRRGFWLHCLAVGTLAESIAALGVLPQRINPSEAFLAGLLHDLGLLALHVCLPDDLQQACGRAEAQGVSLNVACRQIMGLDIRSAGKRLAEHWNLPHALGDVMWLTGQQMHALPELPHRTLIGLVSLADALAARHYVLPIASLPAATGLSEWRSRLGLRAEQLDEIIAQLPAAVAQRAEVLGVYIEPDAQELMMALGRANESLGRINHELHERAEQAHSQQQILEEIAAFHAETRPNESLLNVMGKVARRASEHLGSQFMVVLFQPRAGRSWQVLRYAGNGRLLAGEQVGTPEAMDQVQRIVDGGQVSMRALELLPALRAIVGDERDPAELRLLPLRCGLGMTTILIHDGPEVAESTGSMAGLDALMATWAAGIAAAAQHQGARRLGEQLAQANASLLETQEKLARTRAMASVGEIAAGAAHEMNNPLTVISGRSQLLRRRLKEEVERGNIDASLHNAAGQIVLEAHRLSNLISSLRMFAEPPVPDRQPVDLQRLLAAVVGKFRTEWGSETEIELQLGESLRTPDGLQHASLDPHHIGQALAELIRNAGETEAHHVIVRVDTIAGDQRLTIEVIDDGPGLSEHVLAHAFDPFFSSKAAGRQPGIGLAQARRLVEANGGELTIANRPDGGAIARIILTGWRERPTKVVSNADAA